MSGAMKGREGLKTKRQSKTKTRKFTAGNSMRKCGRKGKGDKLEGVIRIKTSRAFSSTALKGLGRR